MARRLIKLLLVAALFFPCAALNSSCSVLGPILGVPIKLAGSALQMVTSNPVGSAAAAAAVF